MRRATDEQVREALRDVLLEHRVIDTQRRLHRAVQERLQRVDPQRSVTAARVRRLAARTPFARVDVRTRDGAADRVVSRCPVCAGPLERVKNQTLFGGEVTLVLKCTSCEYWTSKRKRIPTKYVFRLR